MSRPITQHPPSALQFPSASRTSSLGFGFASPFPAARSPFTDVGHGNMFPPPTSFNNPFSSPTGMPSGQNAKASKARPSPSAAVNMAPRLMKRSRHSTSPSPPTSPTASMGSPGHSHKRLSITRSKKQRHEQGPPISEELDLGLMLGELSSARALWPS
jgi:hypothetical protein